MTHHSDDEKLIQEVAAIIYGTVPASVIVPWHELDQNRRVEFEDAARAIRRLFEKPQGEPSDAQVEAIRELELEIPTAYVRDDMDGPVIILSEQAAKTALAALRAAGGVR